MLAQAMLFMLTKPRKGNKGKTMKLSKTLLAIVAAVASVGLLSSANATLINGTIGFSSADNFPGGGAGSVTQAGGNTTIHFNNPLSVDFANLDFNGTQGSDVTFTDFTYSGTGTGATLVGGPIVPLWTFSIGPVGSQTTYSFDLHQLVSAVFGVTGGNNMFDLSGEGIVHITGFEDTLATFSIHGNGPNLTFDIIQAGNHANGEAVPDAGSAVSLLGLGLLGVEVLRRKLTA
jgi:hypothetical protein